MQHKWVPHGNGMFVHEFSDHVRIVRADAATGTVYRRQVFSSGEWHDLKGTYKSESRALDEARKADAQVRRELKGWLS